MNIKRTYFILPFTLLLFFAFVSTALSDTQYQSRGNRHEGVKPKLVSGYDIELISVKVDYREELLTLPEQYKLKFYLEKQTDVFLTVRELDYKHYYWMDKVQPGEPWRPGFNNLFEWPVKVIQQLDGLKLHDLGAVARLNRKEPGKIEKVAPVILYHTKSPSVINGYRFTLKTNGDAKLKCTIYKEGSNDPVWKKVIRRQRAGRPFTVKWESKHAAKGPYKLVVSGYFLYSNEPIDQTISFYHQPVVK